MDRATKDRQNLLAVNLGLGANVLLAVLKTTVGIVGGSPALLVEGINSTSDVVYSAIVRVFMGLAGKPPDREHPYGHRQLESVAALVVGAFVVTTGVALFWNALQVVYDLFIGQSPFSGARLIALWVALLTIVVKILLTVYTQRVARRTGSLAVTALGRDHRNDVFSIAAAALGIYLGRTGLAWVDPLAAALVSLLVLKTGIDILRETSADLMAVLPDRSLARQIEQLLDDVEGIDQVDDVRVHCFGPYLLVDVTIGIDGTLSVAEGHEIANCAEGVLWRHIDYLRHVSVHYHPSTPAA